MFQGPFHSLFQFQFDIFQPSYIWPGYLQNKQIYIKKIFKENVQEGKQNHLRISNTLKKFNNIKK